MSPIHRIVTIAAACAALAACGAETKDDGGGPAPAAPKAASPLGAPEARKARILATYDKGLDFLVSQQKDGKWSVQGKADPSFTAMAATAMLERPGGVRPTDKPIADKAIAYIAASFDEDGGIKSETNRNYMTSAAVMALAAAGRPEDKPVMEKATKYVKSLQFTDAGDPSFGGIGYGSDKTRSDLSNTQYALASLRAAGVSEDDPVFKNAVQFLEAAQNRKENEKPGAPSEFKDPATGEKVVRGNDGGAGYRPGDSKAGFTTLPDGTKVAVSYGSMTYALLRCYHLAGVDPKDGRVRAAVDWISKNWTVEKNPGMPDASAKDGLYYYYATIGKTLPAMGEDRLTAPDGKSIDWRDELSKKLIAEQKPEGNWVNAGPRWMESDPVLATSFALTALGACAR
jgi:squalene-hopene/tetraprenyl-beta-curcumene cyclase